MPSGAVVLTALCIAATGVWIASSAADSPTKAPTTLTFKEVDRDATFSHIRNTDGPKRANLQGDLFASVSPLEDEAGNRIGRLHLACTTTDGARNFLKSEMTCTSIAALGDGTITAQFIDKLDRTTVGAVTGGTGAYANTSGTFVSQATKGGAVDTITFGG
jgi:hypothetical protein